MSSSIQKSKTCKAPNCKTEVYRRGECAKHFRRMNDYGQYNIPPRRDITAPRKEHMTPGKTPVQRRKEREAKGITPSVSAIAAAEGEVLDLQTARVFEKLLAPKRYKGAHGGRGSGKSHFFAELLIERCVIDPTVRAVCIREIQISLAQSVKRLIEDKIRSLKVQARFRVLKTHIDVLDDNGRAVGIIIFMGMQNHTADSIKSLEGYDIAWVEEAQSLSQHSFSLLRPTIRKDGSELWFSWNPVSPKDPVDKFFRENPQHDVVCVEANYKHNPWFPEVLRTDMEYDKKRDPDRWLHVWCGQYLKLSQARVFRNWRVGTREEFDIRELISETPRYGGDWGYAVDPTVGIKVKIIGRNLYICAEAYKIGLEIDHSPAFFDSLDNGEMRRWVSIADSARPETISYMNRHGYPKMKAARKGPGSVEEGVEFIKSYDVIIHPDCVHTIDEFTFYSYEIDKKTEEVTPVLADKKNHVIDAVRYAVETVRFKARSGVLF